MAPDRVEDLLSWVVFGVILGGRLGFVLFYQPAYFAADPLAVIRVWEGGMSFHGGLVGVIVSALLYAWRHGISAGALGDAFALVAPIGLFLGRIANFINAELWGRPTAQPWGVIFPGDAAQTCYGMAGQVDGICARHPSQLYEAGLEGLGLGLLLLILFWRGALRYRGLLMGVFLAGYGCARFFVEYFRLADAQFIDATNPLGWVIGGKTWGFTMGQVLCLPMIAVGLWFILRARKRP